MAVPLSGGHRIDHRYRLHSGWRSLSCDKCCLGCQANELTEFCLQSMIIELWCTQYVTLHSGTSTERTLSRGVIAPPAASDPENRSTLTGTLGLNPCLSASVTTGLRNQCKAAPTGVIDRFLPTGTRLWPGRPVSRFCGIRIPEKLTVRGPQAHGVGSPILRPPSVSLSFARSASLSGRI